MTRKASLLSTALVLGTCAVFYFVLAMRERGPNVSIRDSIQPSYWADKITGKDLYDAERQVLKKGNPARKEVCLTIDDGPHPLSCQRLLDTLKAKKVVASFYVIGKQVDGNPDLLRRMFAEGHEVANHTYSHRRLDQLTREEVFDEIRNCDRSVEVVSDRKMLFFRPPGTRSNATVLDIVKQLDHIMVHYTIGAKDFAGTITEEEMTPSLRKLPKITPELIVQYVKKQLQPGGIILLHDNPITAEALPVMIDMIRAEGYEFVSTQQMLERMPSPITISPNPPCGVTDSVQ
jgi:peptidoglycan-N-acetylglucosamine deacetylase